LFFKSKDTNNPELGGGFKQFLFSSLLGEDSHFDSYFSGGLKPPTSESYNLPRLPNTSPQLLLLQGFPTLHHAIRCGLEIARDNWTVLGKPNPGKPKPKPHGACRHWGFLGQDLGTWKVYLKICLMRCEVSLAKKIKKTFKMFEDGFKQFLFCLLGDDLD